MSYVRQLREERKRKSLWIIFAAAAIIMVIAFYVIVTKSGHWLVDNDKVEHATWAVILDGQSADMERSDYTAKLLAQGKVDSVLILGKRVFRSQSFADFYADDFMQLGSFDSNAVFVVPHNDPSTITEAYTIIPWLKEHKADTVLLITGAAATHRVKKIFEHLSGNSPVFRTVDIKHYQYNADSWFSDRESRKTWLREWSALFVSYIDLWPAGTLSAKDSTYYKPIMSYKDFVAKKYSSENPQALLTQMQGAIDTVTDTTKVQEPKADSTKASAK